MRIPPPPDQPVRRHLADALGWESAHLGPETVLDRFTAEMRGRTAPGVPYSAWQLLEHMRIAQRDILDFCLDSEYVEPDWPDEYWPSEAAPVDVSQWETSRAAFRNDLAAVQALVLDPSVQLNAAVSNGSGQTYLREALLVIDHNAYHTGQLVVLWRLLTS